MFLSVAGDGAAQFGQRRNQQQREAPPVAWSHDPPPAGTMVTRAEQVTREGSRVVLEGYAQVAYEGLRIQADRIEIDEEELAVRAEGNVVFERRDEKIVAEFMEGSLGAGTAIFRNARGILGQDFHFVAETLEELEDGAFAIEKGAFTTCAQPNPRWNFTAGRAVVRPEKHVWLRNVSFRVKNIPVTYFPALYYPLEEDGRQTGFLIPRYSNSDLRGHLVSQGFYWAINRSMDTTLSVDHFTVAGTGLGMEYRYRGTAVPAARPRVSSSTTRPPRTASTRSASTWRNGCPRGFGSARRATCSRASISAGASRTPFRGPPGATSGPRWT